MNFVRVERPEDAITPVYKQLIRALEQQQSVLWLVGGGSSIPLNVAVMKLIPDELTHALTVGLTDERFGPVGHPDSNIQQLFDAGFLPKHAKIQPVLMPAVALQETCERYSQIIETAFKSATSVIAQFGVGADGHIAGVLPGTIGVNSKEWVVGYEAGPYTRVTLTLEAIKRIPVAYALVFGDTKAPTLTSLHDQNLSLDEQPAQILKHIPESFVYNDRIGDE